MLAAFGVYWTVFGGWFALGLVLSIYIHEMGHVATLMRYGVRASAPLFLPGLGAVIRLNQAFTDPRQDARVGLAGPIWGTGAAMACVALYAGSHQPIWAALARVGEPRHALLHHAEELVVVARHARVPRRTMEREVELEVRIRRHRPGGVRGPVR